jgi:hypothetical protein
MNPQEEDPKIFQIIDRIVFPETVFGAVIRLVLFGGMIDLVYFGSRTIGTIVILSRTYSDILTLMFSGLLVLLYFEQHRTQVKQREISEKQIEVHQTQMEIQREKNSPDITVEKYIPKRVEQPSSDPTQKHFISLFLLDNAGHGPAEDIEVKYEILLKFEELNRYVRSASFGIYVHTSRLYDGSLIDDEDDIPVDLEGSRSLNSKEFGSFMTPTPIRYTPYAGPAKENEEGHGFTIPTEPAQNFGDAILNLEFPIEDVVIHGQLQYEDLTGRNIESSFLHVRVLPEQSMTFDEAIEEGETIEADRYILADENPLASRYFEPSSD